MEAKPKSKNGQKKAEGRKNLKALRDAVSALNSVQLTNFFAGFDDLKVIQRAVNNAAKAKEGKGASKLEKQIAKLQKELEAVKGAK
ncbi:MAG: hypothetical protein RL095_310 [Verrucomicrobiota bacterium]|jgi:hypothetical protein